MLFLGMNIRVISAYLLEFTGWPSNRTIKLPQPNAFLTDLEQQNNLILFQGPWQARALDRDAYGVWVYSNEAQYKSWIQQATTNKHSLCKKQSDAMFIIFINWKFCVSKTQLRCDYKQNEVVYNERVLP